MGKKLYVGGVSYNTTNETLKEYFSGAGEVVTADVIMDRDLGRSKGFAFVEMGTDEEAQKAIEMFNESSFEGRTLVVNEARPKEENRPAFGGGGGGNRPSGGGFSGGNGGGGFSGGNRPSGGGNRY